MGPLEFGRRVCSVRVARLQLCLQWLNCLILAGAVASIVVIFETRRLPTLWGWSLVAVASISIVSAVVAYFHNPCSPSDSAESAAHFSLLVAAILGQATATLALFAKPEANLRYLRPNSKQQQQTAHVLQEALFLAVLCLQTVALLLDCVVHRGQFLADFDRPEARRSSKMARILAESAMWASQVESQPAVKEELNRMMKAKYVYSAHTWDLQYPSSNTNLSTKPNPNPNPSPNTNPATRPSPNPNPKTNFSSRPNPKPSPDTNLASRPSLDTNPNPNLATRPNLNPNPSSNTNLATRPNPNPNPNLATRPNLNPNPSSNTNLATRPNPNPNPSSNINLATRPNPSSGTNLDTRPNPNPNPSL